MRVVTDRLLLPKPLYAIQFRELSRRNPPNPHTWAQWPAAAVGQATAPLISVTNGHNDSKPIATAKANDKLDDGEPVGKGTYKNGRKLRDSVATGHDEGRPKPKVTELNRTQRDVLWALLAGESNGLEITSRLEAYYGESVNTGRVYPACDKLADRGLIAKDESADGRQNTYKLTADGHAALQRRQSWQNEMRTSGYDEGSE